MSPVLKGQLFFVPKMTSYHRFDCIFDTLQHHSLSLTSSALDHSTTSTPYKRSFNNRSVTFSRKANLGIDVRHVYKRV